MQNCTKQPHPHESAFTLVAKQSASTTLQTVIWKALIAQKDDQITLEAAATFAALLNPWQAAIIV